jgi:hypothetical protein
VPEPAPPRLTGPPEVEALHKIDELIRDRDRIGSGRLGIVRRVVVDALGRWHEQQRRREQITAGDLPTPLPSEVLGSCDAGRGIEAFVLSAEVLDRLPVLMRDTVPPGGLLDGSGVWTQNLANEARDDDGRFAPELLGELRQLGDTYGPLGIAIAAASLTDRRALVAILLDEGQRNPGPVEPAGIVTAAVVPPDEEPDLPDLPADAEAIRVLVGARRDQVHEVTHDGCEEQADALRSEVARLTALLDDASAEADRADRAEALLAQQRATTIQLRDHLDAERRRAEAAEEQLQGGAGPCPLDADPRRPHLDHYPTDAVTLTYPEVRRLIALHLDQGDSDPRLPLVLAEAMRAGETPLRLAEVIGP